MSAEAFQVLGSSYEVAKELGTIADRNRIRIRPPRPRPILPLDRDTVGVVVQDRIRIMVQGRNMLLLPTTTSITHVLQVLVLGSINPLLLLEITAIQI